MVCVLWCVGYEEESEVGLYQPPCTLTETILGQTPSKQLQLSERKREIHAETGDQRHIWRTTPTQGRPACPRLPSA